MKNNGTRLAEKRVYATPGRKVAVHLGSNGRPPIGRVVANLYNKDSLYARIVDVKGERMLVGRNSVKVIL